MTKCKDTGVLISIIAGSEIVFSEVEEIATDLLTGGVDIRLEDGTSIYTSENSKLHQALVREFEDADLMRGIRRIVKEEVAKAMGKIPPIKWNVQCGDCGFTDVKRTLPPYYCRCGSCSEMRVRSVKMID